MESRVARRKCLPHRHVWALLALLAFSLPHATSWSVIPPLHTHDAGASCILPRMRRAHELRLDDSVAKAVHASRHRRVILCALRSEEELPIDDTREIDEDGEQNDSTAAVGMDSMDSIDEVQVFDSSAIQVLEEVTWVPSKMGIVGQWLESLVTGSKEPLYTAPAPTKLIAMTGALPAYPNMTSSSFLSNGRISSISTFPTAPSTTTPPRPRLQPRVARERVKEAPGERDAIQEEPQREGEWLSPKVAKGEDSLGGREGSSDSSMAAAAQQELKIYQPQQPQQPQLREDFKSSLPRDLWRMKNLSVLLDTLDASAGGVRQEDAVVAMNHVKRLEGQASHVRDTRRIMALMCALSEEATRSMSVLSPRHVALAVNAAAAREGGERVLAAAAQRILQMNADPVREYVFPEQTIAMVYNGFARSRCRHSALFRCLSQVILARPKSFQYADNIAVVLSALVKTGYEDAALMQRLSVYTQELSPSRHALSPASAAKILHAFAVTRTRDLQLIAFISARLQDSVRPAARDGGGGMSRSEGEGGGMRIQRRVWH